ncbi:MAG: hypothetical protein J0M12_17230 [Deltaproteobacteria bacterium]|nr:hypothetical protein [Deltaproteobacteria bacterium]
MISWKAIAAITTALSILFPVFDRLLVARQRRWLAEKAILLFITLDDSRIPDLPGKFASLIRRFFQWIFPLKIWSAKGLTAWFAISWVITTFCAVIGLKLDGTIVRSFFDLPGPTFYAVNFVFDLATLSVTSIVLHWISFADLRKSLAGLGLMVALGYLVMICCMVFYVWAGSFMIDVQIPGDKPPVGNALRQLIRSNLAKELTEKGFSDAAEIEFVPTRNLVKVLRLVPDVMSQLNAGYMPDIDIPATIIIRENGREERGEGYVYLRSQGMTLVMAAATFLPVLLVAVIFFFLLSLAFVLAILRLLFRHLLEAMFENNLGTGTHFLPGVVLGLAFLILASGANGVVYLLAMREGLIHP